MGELMISQHVDFKRQAWLWLIVILRLLDWF